MKDEEMAEEYLDEKCKDCYMCSYSEHKNPYKICQRRKDRKQAFLAGLKAKEKENAELKEENRQLKNEVEDLRGYCNQIGKVKTEVLKAFEHIVAR